MNGTRVDVVLAKLCAVVIVVLSLQGLTGYVGYFVAAESAYPQVILVLVGVTLVGLYTLVFGAIDLFYFEAVRVAEAAYSGSDGYGTFKPSPDTVAGRYTNIFQIIIGASLLLGRRGLAKLFSAARYSGAGAS